MESTQSNAAELKTVCSHHPNGQIHCKWVYRNIMLEHFSAWGEDGLKLADLPMKNSKLHGKARYWWPSGAVQREQDYVTDKQHGKSLFFYENGNPQSESNYVDDKQDGLALEWDPDGKLTSRKLFREGRLLGSVTHSYSLVTEQQPPTSTDAVLATALQKCTINPESDVVTFEDGLKARLSDFQAADRM